MTAELQRQVSSGRVWFLVRASLRRGRSRPPPARSCGSRLGRVRRWTRDSARHAVITVCACSTVGPRHDFEQPGSRSRAVLCATARPATRLIARQLRRRSVLAVDMCPATDHRALDDIDQHDRHRAGDSVGLFPAAGAPVATCFMLPLGRPRYWATAASARDVPADGCDLACRTARCAGRWRNLREPAQPLDPCEGQQRSLRLSSPAAWRSSCRSRNRRVRQRRAPTL